MSQRSVISASIQTNFPDNSTNFITPTRLRDEQYTFLYDTVLNEQTSSMSVASASYALTASFALNGGGTINTGSLVTTSSFNAYTASTNTFTGSALITASVSLNTITFTKGNGTTFPITVNTGSGGSSFPFSGSAQITGSLGVTGSIEGTNQNGLKINLGSGNTIPNVGANGNALAFGNSIANNTQNNGFAFGDNHTIANPGYNNFIAGGNGNILNNNRGFAGGGLTNVISADDGAIIGGSSNTVVNPGAIILGGNAQTTIDDQTVHMNRANIGDWSSGNYVSFNNSGSANTEYFNSNLIINTNSLLKISGSGMIGVPSALVIYPNNLFNIQQDVPVYLGGNLTNAFTGSVGQVMTRSGSSVVWATPSGGTVDTGSLATTGSNTFNGTNTFTGSVNIQSASITFLTVDTIVSSSTINNTGSNQLGDTASDTQTLFGTISLKEGNVYMSSGSLGTLWTGSAATQYPNIIFPRVGGIAQSGSAQFTGKNNILMTTGINVPGFSSSFNGNANVIAGGINWSGSATQPNLNTTYLAGTIQVTGSGGSNQVSSTQNNIIGSILVDLSKATGSNQPGVTATNNVINGSLTISSSISGSTTFNTLQVNNNNFAGGGQVIKAAGAGRTTNTTIISNFIGGTANTVSLEGASTAGTGIANALIFGSNLVYSGSSSGNNSSSSVFVGQFNETGSLSQDSQIRFAVGNGANTGSRFTAFYVSASNQTVVKGALIIENSTDTTVFSLTQGGTSAYSITHGGGFDTTTTIPVNATSVFGGGGNNLYRFDVPTRVNSSFLVSGSTNLTGSVTVNGNKQYNVGSFFSTASQSGSANVSQSMTFDTTDISSGVSIVSGSQITLTNAGTYNIQFSAQVDRVSGSGTDVVYIWLKKNGANVTNSAGAVTISGAAAAAKVIAAWNYVVDAAANDNYELVWQSADANIQLIAAAASGNIPAIPSVILTVTQNR